MQCSFGERASLELSAELVTTLALQTVVTETKKVPKHGKGRLTSLSRTGQEELGGVCGGGGRRRV